MDPYYRYEALCGPNTHQFWIYDNETNEFIDPPVDVLDVLDDMDLDNAKRELERLAIEQAALPDGGWLNDGYRYDANSIEI